MDGWEVGSELGWRDGWDDGWPEGSNDGCGEGWEVGIITDITEHLFIEKYSLLKSLDEVTFFPLPCLTKEQ